MPRYWHYFIIVAAGLAAYGPSFRGVYLLDDAVYVTANPDIRQLQPLWRHLADPDRGVVRLSLAVNYAIGGLDPFGYHVFNLLIHLLAALSLYGVVRRTIEIRAEANKAPGKLAGGFRTPSNEARFGVALAISLLWVVHPLTTQAVTYIIQRGESMMALCYLLTLYCLARGATAARAWPWYVGTVLACGTGMGCKEVMITAPLVALLYDRIFLSESWHELVKKRWPVYAALAATALQLLLHGTFAVAIGEERVRAATMGFGFNDITPWQYLFSQPGILLHYLRLVVWPHPLCFDYDWPVAILSAKAVACGIAISLLLAVTGWLLYRRRTIGFLGAAFFLILAPTSSVMPIKDLAFEHRMYLPLAAVITLIVLGCDRILKPSLAKARSVALGIAVAILGILTFQRNGVYGSATAMWSHVVAQRPDHARAWGHLGNAQMEAGRFNEAIESFRASLRVKPDRGEIENNLGAALAQAGQMEAAVEAYQNALAHCPWMTHVHFNLGSILHRLGRLSEAVEHYRAGLAASPQLVPPRNNLGDALRSLGRLTEAESEHRTALQYAPNDVTAHFGLALVLELQGKLEAAVAEYRQVLKLDPNNANAKARLSVIETRPNR